MGFAENYNDVAARQREFFDKYPAGSLQQVSVQMYEVEGVSYLAYTAACYRGPDDTLPGHGTAWERVPGLTNYTRNSELQNAETSAYGRAIVAVGAADTKKGIATREDVESRMAEAEYYEAQQAPVPGFRSSLMAATENLTEAERGLLREWLQEQGLPDRPSKMNAEQADRVCEYIVHGLPKPAAAGAGEQSS